MDVSDFLYGPKSPRHCVHVATEEDAKIVMEWFIERGRPMWRDGKSRSEVTHWGVYGESTVYYPEGTYGSVQYAEENHHTIYEVSDFITEKMAWNEVFVV